MSRCHSCSKQQLECYCAMEKKLLKDKNEKLKQTLKDLIDLIKTSRVEKDLWAHFIYEILLNLNVLNTFY